MKPIKKILLSEKGEFHNMREDKDYTTKYGLIKKKDINKKPGTAIKSHMGKAYVTLNPSFIDQIKNIRRLPQTVALKEIGHIIAETGMGKDSIVVDSGAGSGALSCYMARYVKKVYSFDIRHDHLDVAKENAQMLGISNITFKLHNIYDGIPVKNVDVITLDVPEPWNVIKHTDVLKIGGFIVSYSPCIPQVIDFVNKLPRNFLHVKSVEVIEKQWEITKRKVRPKTMNSFHTGFLTFARKISDKEFLAKKIERVNRGAPSIFDKPEGNENLMNDF
jgi:tRNA (adenine57-N1/adenine58-N1)-methyltransferase